VTRVAVVGAGISGLAAAYALQLRGLEVVVLEQAGSVGGRMQTRSEQGFTWDAGAQFMLPHYRYMRRLMAKLSVSFSRHVVPPVTATVLPGRRIYYTRAGSAIGVLRHPALSRRTRARLGRLMWIAWRYRHRIDWYHPERTAPFDTDSLRAWGDRVLGPDAVDWLLAPSTSGLFFWEAEETPWRYAAALTWAAATGRWRVIAPEGGMGAVPQALARFLDVRLRTTVHQVEVGPSGSVTLSVEDATGRATLEAARAILATPAPVALALVRDPDTVLGSREAAFLRSTRYTYNLTTTVAYDGQPETRAYGVAVPPACGSSLAAIGWEHLKDPRRVPAGSGLGVLMPTHLYSVRRWDAPDEEIGPELATAAAGLYSTTRAKPRFHRVQRWQYAMPVLYPGWTRVLAGALADKDVPGRQVFTCGDYWLGPTTEQALVSGLWAAAAVLRSLGRMGTAADELQLIG